MTDEKRDAGVRQQAAIATMRVCAVVEHIDDEARHALIREGVKFWLKGMSPNEIEQIAKMDRDKLREYVAKHARDDINNRYDAHHDNPAEGDDV